MPKLAASPDSSSVLTLPNTTSGCASEAFSNTGPNTRQGPHQGAQKSTSTIPLAIVSLKLLSFRALVAMFILLLPSMSQVCPKGFAELAGR